MTANEIKELLIELVAEVNVAKLPNTGELALHEQRVTAGNLSVYLAQGSGRIYVQPNVLVQRELENSSV